MKLHKIIILIVVFLVPLCLWQCGVDHPTQDMTILLDTTETNFQHISLETLKDVSFVAADQSNGEHLRILPVNEFSYPPVTDISLEPVASSLLGNEVERRKEVEDYFEAAANVLEDISSQRAARSGSVIFPIVARELHHLHQSSADRKMLVMYTDGMEKSALANFYATTTYQMLRSEPERLQEWFMKQHPLPDLTGIEVYMVFQPGDREENAAFELIVALYTSLLEAQGATVSVGGNLVIPPFKTPTH